MKKILIICSCLFFTNPLSAQWKRAESLHGGFIRCLASDGSRLMAGSNTSGIYLSENDAGSWGNINKGLNSNYIYDLVFAPNYIFAATSFGVMRSSNHGQDWAEANTGLPLSSNNAYPAIHTIRTNQNQIYLLSREDGLFKSANQGEVWAAVYSEPFQKLHPSSLSIQDSVIVVGTGLAGVFLSRNGGKNWQNISTQLPNSHITAVQLVEGELYIATRGSGVFFTQDFGTTWVELNQGLSNTFLSALLVDGQVLMAGTEERGIFRSDDGGKNWQSVNKGIQGLPMIGISSFTKHKTMLLAGTYGGDIYASKDQGRSWELASKGIYNTHVSALTVRDNQVFAGTLGGSMFTSQNGGLHWEFINNGLGYLGDGWILEVINKGIYLFLVSTYGLYRSDNQGKEWIKLSKGLPEYAFANTLVQHQGSLYTGTSQGLFRSQNNGDSWEPFNTGLPEEGIKQLLVVAEKELWALTYNGRIFSTKFNRANWTSLGEDVPNYILTLASNESSIFTGTNDGLFRSNNFGKSWTSVDPAFGAKWVQALAIKGNNIFAGIGYGCCYNDFGSLHLSTDNGETWEKITDPQTALSNEEVNSICLSEDKIFVGTTRSVWHRALSDFLLEGDQFSKIKIHPNPGTDKLIIDCTEEMLNNRYQIVNCLGQIMQKGHITKIGEEISIIDLQVGVYFLNVPGSKVFAKFVKL